VLETIGYGPEVAAAFAPWAAAADAAVGRVTRLDDGAVAVLTETGPQRAGWGGALLQKVATDPAAAPCPGDWVVLREWPDRRITLEAVLPRRTAVAALHDERPPLCANVHVLAVLAPSTGRRWPARLLDRLAGAAPGVDLVVCGHSPADPERLRARVAGRLTVALAGPAPARAALLRAVVGTEVLVAPAAGAVLVAVPGGGALVDVPGLVDLGEGKRPPNSGAAL
jgi:ribosome biogenesis GTPase